MPILNNRPQFRVEDFFPLTDEGEKLKFLVNFAMLAPSSHNTQPWLFKIRSKSIELWVNTKRALEASDANNRQLFISLGCALENLLVAADYYGWGAEVDYFPEPTEANLAARLTFEGLPRSGHVDHHPDHLIFSIFTRHNNREPYKDQEVPEGFLVKISSLETPEIKIDTARDESIKKRIIEIVLNAIEQAFHDKNFRNELSHWMRPSLKKYRDGMPGYNIGIPWPMSFFVPFIIRTQDVAKQQRKMDEPVLRATPAFIVISTQTDDPVDWLRAGQMFERIALMATQAGLKIGVLAAAIQIDNFYQDLQDALTTVFRPQMFFRLGYADKVLPQSPRLRLKDVLLEQ